jgi:hypothetical protein
MTLGEFNLVTSGYLKHEQKMLAWQAWTIVALDRTRRLPPLAKFLGEKSSSETLSKKIIKSLSLHNDKTKLLERSPSMVRGDGRNHRGRAKPHSRTS